MSGDVVSVAEALAQEVTSLAFCWRLQRRDGMALGFTSHDRDIRIDHFRYHAAPGMLPSAIIQSDGFETDSLDIDGALRSDLIREADLLAGRWQGAHIRLLLVDWTAPQALPLFIARGELGEVSLQGQAFRAELLSPLTLLDAPVIEKTSPACRAQLGDKRCRAPMAGRQCYGRIASVEDAQTLMLSEAEPSANAYGYGRLRWLEGAGAGLVSAVAASDGARVILRDALPFLPQPGWLVEIEEGCDKRFETCRTRFANAPNFRGEPHLPGMDLLTRYPGAS